MKAEDMRLEEIISFEPGLISLHGRRLVIHDIRAFAQIRKDLVEMVGLDRARHVLTRFGYYWGTADAAAMTRLFKWDSLEEWLKAGTMMHGLQGVTRVMIKKLQVDQSRGTFEMEVHWLDSGEVEEHLLELGPSENCICWMLTGYASGYASFCLGTKVYFVEQQCRGRGDAVCRAIGKDQKSWGDAISHELGYYQAVDHIHEKIMTLTEELKRQTRELDRQRARLKVFEARQEEGLVEVRSANFAKVMELARQVARFDSSVLITGESGTGKEVLAHYIHRLSSRSGEIFLGVNCGALPETLLESELFGHKAGSFTGALGDRAGLFEQANGGTLFLDEIGDITPAMQLKLLRVLQEREVRPVGGETGLQVNVRVIAATNKKLREEIKQGRFREDLYYRLGVIEIEVPPLRDRVEDIIPLAQHFLTKVAGKLGLKRLRFEPRCYEYLQDYHWPGNVRELENVIERAAVLSHNGVIDWQCLPRTLLASEPAATGQTGTNLTLAELERRHILAVIGRCEGNRTQAAKVLDISAATLWRKLKQYERD